MTRGALYHHFGDKRDLFRAVHEDARAALVEQIAAAARARIRARIRSRRSRSPPAAVLEVATRLEDRPRDSDRRAVGPGLGGVARDRHALRAGSGRIGPHASRWRAGASPKQPVRPLAHLLVAALGEAAIMVATAQDPAKARAEVEPALELDSSTGWPLNRAARMHPTAGFMLAQRGRFNSDDPRGSPQGDDHEDPRALRRPGDPARRPLGPPDRAGSTPARRRRPRIRHVEGRGAGSDAKSGREREEARGRHAAGRTPTAA